MLGDKVVHDLPEQPEDGSKITYDDIDVMALASKVDDGVDDAMEVDEEDMPEQKGSMGLDVLEAALDASLEHSAQFKAAMDIVSKMDDVQMVDTILGSDDEGDSDEADLEE